jgi:hypothetical protein
MSVYIAPWNPCEKNVYIYIYIYKAMAGFKEGGGKKGGKYETKNVSLQGVYGI